MIVTYTNGSIGYDAVEFFVGGRATRYNHVKVTLVSDKNTHVLLKPFDNGANEKSIELVAGQEVTVEYDVTPSDSDQWACKQIIFFATNEGDALSATVNFKLFEYSVK